MRTDAHLLAGGTLARSHAQAYTHLHNALGAFKEVRVGREVAVGNGPCQRSQPGCREVDDGGGHAVRGDLNRCQGQWQQLRRWRRS